MFPNMNFMSDKWDAVVWTPAWLKSLSKTSTSASDNTLLSRWKMTCFTLEARVFKGASKAILRWFKFISIEKESTSWLCFLFETTVFQYPCTEFVARPLSSAIPSFLPLRIMVLFLSTFTTSLLFVQIFQCMITLTTHERAIPDAFQATSSPSWFQLHSDVNKNLVPTTPSNCSHGQIFRCVQGRRRYDVLSYEGWGRAEVIHNRQFLPGWFHKIVTKKEAHIVRWKCVQDTDFRW